MKHSGWLLLAALGLLGAACADPCEGPLPGRGEMFSSSVRYVGDGDSLCVGRLEDFYAPELHAPGGAAVKQALQRVTRGRQLQCRAGMRSYDRVVARCMAQGAPVADLRGAPA